MSGIVSIAGWRGAYGEPQRTKPKTDAERAADLRRALDIRRHSCSIAGTPGETYLHSRGLRPDVVLYGPTGWQPSIRWTDDAVRKSTPPVKPGIIIDVQDPAMGAVTGIQRTFFRPDGTVEDSGGKKNKKALGAIWGNAAMLDCPPDGGGEWGIAEGVETAMACRQLYRIPVWAAIFGGNMHAITPPPWARKIIIFADHDAISPRLGYAPGFKFAQRALLLWRQRPGIEIRPRSPQCASVRISPTSLRMPPMPREMPNVEDVAETIIPKLGEIDAGDDNENIPPRGWLLGNVFCRRFVSSLIAYGGVGKTALRIAQLLALATGRQLTGEHVFQRCRVLMVSLKDDIDELRRRVRAAMLHYSIKREDVAGHMLYCAPGTKAGKLAVVGDKGTELSTLGPAIEDAVVRHDIDLVSIDPFVKAHSVEENGNSAVDDVMQILSDLASRNDIAVDVPHHTSKGIGDPGNANRSRGATAMKDACRLVYTLTPMTEVEAQAMGVSAADRRRLVRMDSAKVNIAPPMSEAKWFRLVGVRLGNGAGLYPHGDEVQAATVWQPPDAWQDFSRELERLILVEIEAGLPDGRKYSASKQAQATDRAAWRAVVKHAPDKSEAQAIVIIKSWLKRGTLIEFRYHDEKQRKELKGVRVNADWHDVGA